MNNLLKLGVVGVMVAGLLAGCGTSVAKDKEVKGKATAESNSKSASVAEIDPREWDEPASENSSEKMEFTPTTEGWVTEQLEIFRQAPDSKLMDAGLDIGYDYYLKADVVSRTMGNYVRVEDVDLEKDFENLQALANIIIKEQDVRSADIDLKKYGVNKKDAIKEWKPLPEQMQMAYDYMMELLTDLNITLNYGGKGETFGVLHQLHGDKVKVMESFISENKES